MVRVDSIAQFDRQWDCRIDRNKINSFLRNESFSFEFSNVTQSLQQRQPKDVTNIMAYDIIENDGLLLMPSAITNLIQKLLVTK